MLRVTLEIVPFGMGAAKRTLGVMEISNVGGTDERADYEVTMNQEGTITKAEIKHYPRKNRAWNLVLLALSKIDFK